MTLWKKPVGFLKLDGRNTLNNGLAFCFAFRGQGDWFDLFTGARNLTPNTSKSIIPGPTGNSPNFDGTTNTTFDEIATGYQPLVTSDGVGTGDVSICVISNPISEANRRFQVGTYTFDGINNGVYLVANALASEGGSDAGRMVFVTSQSGVLTASLAGGVDGNWHIWHGVRQDTNLTLYQDGNIVGTNSGTVKDVAAAGTSFGIGRYPDGVNFAYANHGMTLAMGWNRALSPAEALSHAKNPWQILAKIPLVYQTTSTPTVSSVVFRRTMSGFGTRVGSRQIMTGL